MRSEQRMNAAVSLRADAATARVCRALDEASIRVVLLRGPAISWWLYPEGSRRGYNDVDLLVAPADHDRSVAILDGLGYTRFFEGAAELEQTDHADAFTSAGAGPIDLHRTLRGIGADPTTVWEVIGSQTEELTIAEVPVRIPSVANRLLIVALHAAQHSGGDHMGEDLEHALERATTEQWRDASESAQRLSAVPAFATGLRARADGERLVSELGIAAEGNLPLELRAGGEAAPLTLGLSRLADTPGIGAKLRLLVRELIPSPVYMRIWSPWARRGPLQLGLAYLARPFWLLWRLPRALRAYLDARRAVRRREREHGSA